MTWLAADLIRHRRVVLGHLGEQNVALQRDGEQRERLAAQEERARIAREMRDTVAHNLSVIVVQADGGAYRAGVDPVAAVEQSKETLEIVAATARAALAESRPGGDPAPCGEFSELRGTELSTHLTAV